MWEAKQAEPCYLSSEQARSKFGPHPRMWNETHELERHCVPSVGPRASVTYPNTHQYEVVVDSHYQLGQRGWPAILTTFCLRHLTT